MFFLKKKRIKTCIRFMFVLSCWLAKERFGVSDRPCARNTLRNSPRSPTVTAMRHEKTVVEGI